MISEFYKVPFGGKYQVSFDAIPSDGPKCEFRDLQSTQLQGFCIIFGNFENFHIVMITIFVKLRLKA